MQVSPVANLIPNGIALNPIGTLGKLAVTVLAVNALSNLPKADALGHFWKAVNEDCYYQCTDYHDWKGLVCFTACVTNRNFNKA